MGDRDCFLVAQKWDRRWNLVNPVMKIRVHKERIGS